MVWLRLSLSVTLSLGFTAPLLACPPSVLERLAEELAGLDEDHPKILLGDFNTPRRSVHFGPLLEQWHNAFASAGHGFGFTWPAPFPGWDLDQIWVDSHWHVQACRTVPTVRSDHLALVADLAPSR